MSNTTINAAPKGPEIIQIEDFYQSAGVLHPLVIGTISLIALFAYLRISSNRSVAPLSLFDKIVSVALGSTLAGIVNGTALVRGLIALAVLLFWQYVTSYMTSRFSHRCSKLLSSPALVIAFRDRALEKIMKAHRVSSSDLYGALRGAGVWNLCEIEVVAIEPNGQFSVFKKSDYPQNYDSDVLWELAGYRALREHEEESRGKSRAGSNKDKEGKDQDDAAIAAC